MVTLREDGWRKAARGITSVSEVLRVTREEEAGEAW
jgi:type II secretory ATPase GspE/PulE/Tfp pilus assembly ATPase PilB-like protein